MVEVLRRSPKPNDRGAGDLIFKKLDNPNAEISRSLANVGPCDVITGKWLFDLLELQYAQSKGIILDNVGRGIIELCKIPRGSWGAVLEIQKDFGADVREN